MNETAFNWVALTVGNSATISFIQLYTLVFMQASALIVLRTMAGLLAAVNQDEI